MEVFKPNNSSDPTIHLGLGTGHLREAGWTRKWCTDSLWAARNCGVKWREHLLRKKELKPPRVSVRTFLSYDSVYELIPDVKSLDGKGPHESRAAKQSVEDRAEGLSCA